MVAASSDQTSILCNLWLKPLPILPLKYGIPYQTKFKKKNNGFHWVTLVKFAKHMSNK